MTPTPEALAAAEAVCYSLKGYCEAVQHCELTQIIDAAGVARLVQQRDETARYLREQWLQVMLMNRQEIEADIRDQPLNLKDEAEQLAACLRIAAMNQGKRDLQLKMERDVLLAALRAMVDANEPREETELQYFEREALNSARRLLAELDT